MCPHLCAEASETSGSTLTGRSCPPQQDFNTTRYHLVAARRLLKTDLQPGGYQQTMLGFSFQLGIFPRDGEVHPNPSTGAPPSRHPQSSILILFVLQLFVNNVQINSSNLLSGDGVIHGLPQVLSILRNRCDQTTTLKFRVTSTDGSTDRSTDRSSGCAGTRN